MRFRGGWNWPTVMLHDGLHISGVENSGSVSKVLVVFALVFVLPWNSSLVFRGNLTRVLFKYFIGTV